MHVGIDALGVIPGEIGGGTTYVRELVRALDELAPAAGVSLTVFATPRSAPAFAGLAHVLVDVSRFAPERRAVRIAAEQLTLPARARALGIDVLHFPANMQSLAALGIPTVLTVHDLSPWFYHERYDHRSPRNALLRFLVARSCAAATRIVADSEFSRGELRARLGERVAAKTDVVYLGSRAPAAAAEPPEAVPSLVGAPFFLYVGGTALHKNVDGLVRGWERFAATRPDWRLVLAGPAGTGHDAVLGAIAETSAGEGVRVLGYVPPRQLDWLYRNARAVVVPSLYEGFGLPVLEAMHRERPVISARAASLPEVAGDAAVYARADDPASFGEAFARLADDEPLAARLVALGRERVARFTWRATAERMLATYRAVALTGRRGA